MRSFAFLLLTLPLCSFLSLAACGDEPEAPAESAPATSQGSSGSADRPAQRELRQNDRRDRDRESDSQPGSDPGVPGANCLSYLSCL